MDYAFGVFIKKGTRLDGQVLTNDLLKVTTLGKERAKDWRAAVAKSNSVAYKATLIKKIEG